MLDLLLKNGRLVNEKGIWSGNIGIKEGKIVALNSLSGDQTARKVIDLKDKIVTPGCIDAHVHIPVEEDSPRGNFFTEGRAALAGGTTMVVDFLKGKERSLPETFAMNKEIIDELAAVDYGFHAVILHEHDLEDIAALHDQGVVSFKHIMADCNGLTGLHTGFQYYSFQEIARVGSIATVHAESEEIQAYIIKKYKEENQKRPIDHARSRTILSEVEAISRSILLAEEAGTRLHVFHISSGRGAQLVKEARQRGLPVTGETCPHYLYFTREDVKEQGPFLIMNPSLKFAADRQQIWRLLRQGMVDMVTSDHYAPLKKDKESGWQDCWSVEGGVPGIETRTLLLAAREDLSWSDFVRMTSFQPARIFGLYPRKGTIEIGADADLVVWQKEERELQPETLKQTADWTPFAGLKLKYVPYRVYLRGKQVYKEGEYTGKAGDGNYIPGKGGR
ncbi:MAG: dihydroorotase [Bacillota bacterium]